jgi:hypothetical protein
MAGDTYLKVLGGSMSLTFRDVPLARPLVGPDSRSTVRAVDRVANGLTIMALSVAAILAAGAFGLALYGYSHGDVIYEGVTVAGVDVGGMDRADAGAVIAERFDAYAAAPMTVEAAGQTFVITPRDVGAGLDLEATLDRAFAYGRTGSFLDRSARWARGLLSGSSVAPVVRVDGAALDAGILTIASAVDRAPSDAYVAMDGEAPELVPDVPGIAVDRKAARTLLADRFARLDGSPISLPVPVVQASVPADRLAGAVPSAGEATAAPLVLSSAEGSWSLAPEDLRQMVAAEARSVRRNGRGGDRPTLGRRRRPSQRRPLALGRARYLLGDRERARDDRRGG